MIQHFLLRYFLTSEFLLLSLFVRKSNNPKTAVAEFLKTNSDFVVDQATDEKLLISAAPGGCLKRIK